MDVFHGAESDVLYFMGDRVGFQHLYTFVLLVLISIFMHNVNVRQLLCGLIYVYVVMATKQMTSSKRIYKWSQNYHCGVRVSILVLYATFNNISVISRWPVLLVEETGLPGENHRAVASPWAEFDLTTLKVIGTDCVCALGVPDEGYPKNALSALNLISMFLLPYYHLCLIFFLISWIIRQKNMFPIPRILRAMKQRVLFSEIEADQHWQHDRFWLCRV
jgi:hypothetical protein